MPSRTEIQMAHVVLRALGYLIPQNLARWDADSRAALREFQGTANRAQGKHLAVDGILGNDSLNALAWYGSSTPAAVDVTRAGLTTADWQAVQAMLLARQNRPWGLGTAPRPTRPRTPVPTPSGPTTPPDPAPSDTGDEQTLDPTRVYGTPPQPIRRRSGGSGVAGFALAALALWAATRK